MKILMILLCKMLTSHGDENPQQTLLKKSGVSRNSHYFPHFLISKRKFSTARYLISMLYHNIALYQLCTELWAHLACVCLHKRHIYFIYYLCFYLFIFQPSSLTSSLLCICSCFLELFIHS